MTESAYTRCAMCTDSMNSIYYKKFKLEDFILIIVLFVFVILLLVVGVSSMAATFIHRPRHMGYMNGEYQYHNFGMYERTYNKDYCSNNYYSDSYYNGENRGCCSGSRWY